MPPQRRRMNSKNHSFSGLFWFSKVPRATGTLVIPLRACQDMKSEGTFFGKIRPQGSTNPTCRALRMSDWNGNTPQSRDSIQKQKSIPESLRKQKRRASWISRSRSWGEENQSEAQAGLQDQVWALNMLWERMSWDASTQDLLGFSALKTLSSQCLRSLPTLHKIWNCTGQRFISGRHKVRLLIGKAWAKGTLTLQQ